MKNYLSIQFPLLLIVNFTLCNISAQTSTKETYFPAKATINQRNTTPIDTSDYSIRIIGQTNSVTVNGVPMATTNDTTAKKNTIHVSGEGNTISVVQTNNKSEVIITQKGGNNKVIISQHE